METDARTCWVCYNSEDDEPNVSWIKPCNCRGSTQWVHQHCLQRWVDEKQRGNSSTNVNCRMCNAQYLIKYPRSGLILRLMETADNWIYKVCPFFAGGFVVTSLYWSGVTYGAVTVMQVMGHAEAVQVMEQTDPLLLLIGLPALPVLLVTFKLLRWNEFLLGLWRKYSYKSKFLNKLIGAEDIPEWRHEYNLQFPMSSNTNIPRLFVEALLVPSISSAVGSLLYSHVHPKWQRTALGGLTFIIGKGIVNMFYQQTRYLRNCRRTIVDYDETLAARAVTPVAAPESLNIE